jgi:hypothetical protein
VLLFSVLPVVLQVFKKFLAGEGQSWMLRWGEGIMNVTCLCGGNRALDLDDVELVQMLLKEERTTLNYTYGLHYAAMYCDPKIMVDLLKLETAGDLGDMWLAHLSRYWFFH